MAVFFKNPKLSLARQSDGAGAREPDFGDATFRSAFDPKADIPIGTGSGQNT